VTPREAVAKACREAGERQVALWCAELIMEPDWEHPVLKWIGGASLAAYRERDLTNEVNEYWLRVWGARALLYAWAPQAAPAVVAGLDDPAWRVREMCGKVARLRELGEAAEPLARLTTDETVRVRLVAVKALAVVGEGEHAAALHDACHDPDMTVRDAARSAVYTLGRRLERPL
jgi:HEAT repeat protein